MTMDEIRQLPPNDPRRVEWVLAYINNGAAVGLGAFEWDTIKACLREVGAQIVRPPDSTADIATGILEAAGVFADLKQQHLERCVADIAAGVACAFGADHLSPHDIAKRARYIFEHVRMGAGAGEEIPK